MNEERIPNALDHGKLPALAVGSVLPGSGQSRQGRIDTDRGTLVSTGIFDQRRDGMHRWVSEDGTVGAVTDAHTGEVLGVHEIPAKSGPPQ